MHAPRCTTARSATTTERVQAGAQRQQQVWYPWGTPSQQRCMRVPLCWGCLVLSNSSRRLSSWVMDTRAVWLCQEGLGVV